MQFPHPLIHAAALATAGFLLCGLAPAPDREARLLPPPMDRLYENRLQAETDEYLSINLYNIAVDPKQAADPARFTIISRDDPAYAAARGVHPVASGSRTRAERVALRKKLLVKGTHVFLKLPTRMRSGKHYRVETTGLGSALPALAPLLFDDTRQVSDTIRVNQLGYLPDYAKRAYVGQYLGDLGGMPLRATSFEVLDRRGRRVFTGPVRRRAVHEELVGQQVYELDFSAFRAPGAYRLRVPGVGLSYLFEIGVRALNPLRVNLMRGHYHQRCGMAIDAAYSRHHRDSCHLDDAFQEARAEKTSFVQAKAPLYPTHYDDRIHPAIHGHHDAGDYGKYTVSGAHYVFAVLNAMALFPDRLRADDNGLPYSGNGVPDLIEECKWELDWLEAMQDPADGGVFGVILPNSGGYEMSMPPARAHRLFFPKDTVFTGAYAAALARAGRSPEIRKYYPAEAKRYLERAVAAWGFLEKHDVFVHYFHYGAEFDDWDERCWAAAELYAATGDEAYHRYFLQRFEPERKRYGWSPLFEAVGNAVETYTFLHGRPRDAAMLDRCRKALRGACAMHLADSAAFPYRLSMPGPTIQHGNYGWVFPGELAGYDLLMGYALDHDRRYLQCALDNQDYTCGANPSGYFLQTGLGAKRNIEAVSNQSTFDDVIEPVPGLPLGIGSGEMYWLNDYGKAIAEGTYPEKWPLLNRWYDGFNVSTEFTTGPLMRETVVAAFFADPKPHPHPRPTVRIVADHLSGTAPLAVRFRAETSGAPIREVFWDFGDESFSTQRAPVHRFTDPGRQYPLAVTVIDEDGYSGYAEAEANCLLPNAPFPREEYRPDSRTLLLCHLNGNLRDASGHGLDLKVDAKRSDERRPYRFAPRAPSWMGEPAGSCLVLDGAEQFTAVIRHELVPDPSKTALTVEMRLYLHDFAGWSYPDNPTLLGVRGDWDSALAWRQETWDRASAPLFGGAVSSAEFARRFPRERWCWVKLEYDGKGSARFLVDGESWGTEQGAIFKPKRRDPLTFTLGPFHGMVDEVRVRTGAG